MKLIEIERTKKEWINPTVTCLHFHSTSLQFTLTQWIEWLSWVGEWMARSLRVTFRQLIHSFHWMNVNWLKLIAPLAHTVLHSINPAQFNHCVNVIEWRIEWNEGEQWLLIRYFIHLQFIQLPHSSGLVGWIAYIPLPSHSFLAVTRGSVNVHTAFNDIITVPRQ